MSRYSSHEDADSQAGAPAGQSTDISPEVREVLHMLEVFEHQQPANARKR